MKRILSATGNIFVALVFISVFPFNAIAQNSTKHIKMVKVIDGEKTELDTVIESSDVFIWNGDTINGGGEMKWVSDGDMKMNFDIDVQETADGKVIIMKSGNNAKPGTYTFKMDGDSAGVFTFENIEGEFDGNHKVMIINGDDEMMFPPHHPHPMVMHQKRNVIDLSDPGIISYEKKELKNGNEKITIVRKKPVEKDEEIVIINAGGHPAMHGNHAAKTITVTSTDNGDVKIIKNGKVMHYEKGEKDGEFITEDGKMMRIEKTKKNDGKTMEIKVEVEEEK